MDKRLILIKSTVCDVLGFNSKEFNKASRKQHIVDARHYYHYLCKELTFIKLKEIIELSGLSHCSVYHSYNTVNGWLVSDKEVQNNIDEMKRILKKELFDI